MARRRVRPAPSPELGELVNNLARGALSLAGYPEAAEVLRLYQERLSPGGRRRAPDRPRDVVDVEWSEVESP